MRCPRCRQPLARSIDASYGFCFWHGEVRIDPSPPLDIPMPYSKQGERQKRTCIDCGTQVSGRDTKRCRSCADKKLLNDPRLSHKARPGSGMVHARGLGS